APAPFFFFYTVVFGAVWFLTRPATPAPAGVGGSFSPSAIGVIVAMLVLVVAMGMTHPPQAYDSLNYHLYFPARWIQDGRLSIIPTPFGDEAPAYAPVKG